jgi:DNA polymerase-3 subunit alpha
MAALLTADAGDTDVSLSDFLSRVGSKNLNKKSLESLIRAGALDRFAPNGSAGRGTLMQNIDMLLSFHRDATKEAPQDSLFAAMPLAAPDLVLVPGPETTLIEKLNAEKELLGIYVSGHPLDSHTDSLEKAKFTLSAIKAEPQPGLPLIVPVLVDEVRTLLTKSGEKMAFIKLSDKTDSIEAVVFPKLFKERGTDVVSGRCLLVKGTVSNRNGELSLALDNLKAI